MWKILLVLAALTVTASTCAHGPNPCIGSAKDRETMPCTCPATLNPACYPFPSDAKRADAGARD